MLSNIAHNLMKNKKMGAGPDRLNNSREEEDK